MARKWKSVAVKIQNMRQARLEQTESQLFLIPAIAFSSTSVYNNNPFAAAGFETPLSLRFHSSPSFTFWQKEYKYKI